MKDGITTRSGNSRYLKSVENFLNLYPNYEAFANALIAGTLPVDLNGINPAGWQQLGTSLSKANLLSDETESAIFGNAADRTVSQALSGLNRAANKLKLIAKYTVAGAYEWTCPGDGEYIAVIIGGGGKGGSRRVDKPSSGTAHLYATGGASGFVSYHKAQYTKNQNVSVVVGKGGIADSVNGGSSSFDSITANGGEGGTVSSSSNTEDNYRNGGQPAKGSNYYLKRALVNEPYIANSNADNLKYPNSFAPTGFLDEYGLQICMMCAGGGGFASSANSNAYKNNEPTLLSNGKTCSPAVTGSPGNGASAVLSSVTPTDVGAGSGACVGVGVASATSGDGADGGVFIYKIQGAAA